MALAHILTIKRVLIGVLVATILVVGWIIYSKDMFVMPDSETDVTISLKWVNQAKFAGIFVAQELGFYKDSNLNVTIDTFEAGDSVIDDIKNGTSQFGLLNANELLSHYAKGEDLLAVAAFYQTSPYIIASLKIKNIESPAQFKGRRLAVKGGRGSEAYTVFDLLRASGGLSRDDVSFVELPLGPSEKDDLVAERADVIGFYRTRLYQFEKEGLQYNVIYPEQYGAGLYNDILVVTKEFAEEYPEVVTAFVRETVKGWEHALLNKEEAIATTFRFTTEDVYKDIDFQRYILETSEPLIRPTNNFQIGEMSLDRWQSFYDALRARGFIVTDINVEEVFTNEFLPKSKLPLL